MRFRLNVPIIPPPSPKKYPFPRTIYEIFVAEGGLGCDVIPRSRIDHLNTAIKWVPIKSQKSKFLDTYNEHLEPQDSKMLDVETEEVRWNFIMSRKERVVEEEVLPKITEMAVEMEDMVQVEYSSPRSSGTWETIGQVVRKRKSQTTSLREEEEKRVKYTYGGGGGGGQMSRVCEYMVLHGRPLPTIQEEPISPGSPSPKLSSTFSPFAPLSDFL